MNNTYLMPMNNTYMHEQYVLNSHEQYLHASWDASIFVHPSNCSIEFCQMVIFFLLFYFFIFVTMQMEWDEPRWVHPKMYVSIVLILFSCCNLNVILKAKRTLENFQNQNIVNIFFFQKLG